MTIIYKATNTVNGKCYIGKTVKSLHKRRIEHEKSSRTTGFQGALKKYGPEKFQWIILEECDLSIASNREMFWIESYDSIKNGYNLTPGGDGAAIGLSNVSKRPEVREKLRRNSTGRFHTEETKQQIKESMLGFKHSNETKQKIALASIGRVKPQGNQHPRSVEYIITNPSGDTFIIKGMRKFCRDNNLNAKLLRRTAAGLQEEHKGFKCQRVE